MTVRITRLSDAAALPKYESAGAAGFDLAASSAVTIAPGAVALVPTGLVIEVPRGHFLGIFARSSHPIDFEALDDQPVDLLFLLLAPENAGADHLKALARIARVLREPGTPERIRATRDPDVLYAILTRGSKPQAA